MKKIAKYILISTMILIGCASNQNEYLNDLQLSKVLLVDDKEVDESILGFYYGYSLTKHVNQYYEYFDADASNMIGFNIEEDINALQNQKCTVKGYTDKSWEYYFLLQALETYQSVEGLFIAAKKEGYTVTKEDTKLANQAYQQIQEYCKTNTIKENDYLHSMYGKEMTKEKFIDNYARIEVTKRYNAKLETYIPTSDEIEEAYQKHQEDIDTVSIYYQAFEKNSKEEAEAFKNAIATPEDFQTMAANNISKTETLRTNLRKQDLPEYLQEPLFTKDNIGKVMLIEGDSSYDVVMLISREKPTYLQANIATIYLDARESETDTLTDQKITICKEFADSLLQKFDTETDGSLDSFYEFNKTYSDDKNNQGNYDNVSKGDTTKEIEQWLFDTTREIGDRAVLPSVYGYTIVYFKGYGEESYYQQSKEKAQVDKFEDKIDNYKKEHTFSLKDK